MHRSDKLFRRTFFYIQKSNFGLEESYEATAQINFMEFPYALTKKEPFT